MTLHRQSFRNRMVPTFFIGLFGVTMLACIPQAQADTINIYDPGLTSNFYIQLFNVDDNMQVSISNGNLTSKLFANQDFGEGPYNYNFTNLVAYGLNKIQIEDFNYISGYTYGWKIFANNILLSSAECGVFNTYGCNNNSYQTGLVYNTSLDINVQQSVPEPGSLILLGTGLVGLGLVLQRSRRRRLVNHIFRQGH